MITENVQEIVKSLNTMKSHLEQTVKELSVFLNEYSLRGIKGRILEIDKLIIKLIGENAKICMTRRKTNAIEPPGMTKYDKAI